jgi:hypothetical protein
MSLDFDFATVAYQRGLDAKISLRSGEFLFHEGDDADALISSRAVSCGLSAAVWSTRRCGLEA